MKTRWLLMLLCSYQIFAQNEAYDLRDQFSLVKDLYPEVKVIGLFIGERDFKLFEETIGVLQRDFNIRIALAVIKSPRKRDMHILEHNFKKMTIDMLNKDAGAIIFGFGKDKLIQTTGVLKVVTKICAGFEVPVFSPHKKALQNGCTGQFSFRGEWWRCLLDAKKAESLLFPPGEDDDRYSIIK
jgi:hypothetical protein